MLKALFASPHKLTPQERKTVTWMAGWVAIAAVFFVVALAAITAGNVVSADSPYWDAVLLTRLVLVRLPLALAVATVGFYLALGFYSVFNKTYIGRRLTLMEEGDGGQIGGMKTGNAGTIMAMLFLACIAGLALAVLR
jgi:hypothetical protein